MGRKGEKGGTKKRKSGAGERQKRMAREREEKKEGRGANRGG